MKFKIGDEVLVKTKIEEIRSDGCYMCKTDLSSYLVSNIICKDENIESKAYEQGLADAWELAKKIALPYGGNEFMIDTMFSASELESIFGSRCYDEVLSKFTAEEALAKIEAYEREKGIKVGDVVRTREDGFNCIVTTICSENAYVMYDDGSCGEWKVDELIKTGKYIDIKGLLKQIGE